MSMSKWEERQAQRARDIEKVRGQYPFLTFKDDAPGVSSHALAARNARVLLKREFPGVKFFVSTDTYAEGSSMRVSWHDLEGNRGAGSSFQRAVNLIVEQFEYGRFDGMTDSYDYHDGEQAAFGEAFGAVKYAHAEVRFLSDSERAKLAQKALDKALPKAQAVGRRRGPGPGRL